MKMLRPPLAKFLGTTAITLFITGLVFRFAVYSHMYIAPDSAYGISDFIEFLLGIALIAVLVLALIAAVALTIRGPRENRIAAA